MEIIDGNKTDLEVARIETVNILWENQQFDAENLDLMLSLAGERLNHSYAATDQIANKSISAIPFILGGVGLISNQCTKFIFEGLGWQAFLSVVVLSLAAISVAGALYIVVAKRYFHTGENPIRWKLKEWVDNHSTKEEISRVIKISTIANYQILNSKNETKNNLLATVFNASLFAFVGAAVLWLTLSILSR